MKKILFKKQLLLLVLACMSYTTIHSQVAISEKYRHDIFDKIGHGDNLLYTFNAIPKEYRKQDLTLYNVHGKKLTTTFLESKQGLVLVDCISLGNNTLFYFDYNYSKNILLLMFDVNGNEISRKDFEYLKISDQEILKLGEDKFCLVSGVKFKKPGIKVECFDNNLTSVWNYEKSTEDSKYYLELATASNNGSVAILYAEKSKNHFLLSIDPTGKEVGNTLVKEDEIQKFKPYHLQFIGNEEILLVADMGATNDDVFKAMPTGTNIKRFNLKGEETSNGSINFSEIQEKMGDRFADGSLCWKMGPALRVLDVVMVDGKHTLVCESYQINERIVSEVATASATPMNVSIGVMSLLDLYLIELDNLTAIKRIWKPTRNVAIKGVTSTFSIGDFCSIMDENGMFGYQFMDQGELFVRSISQNFEYFNHISLKDDYDLPNSRTYWGTVVNKDYRVNGSEQLFVKSGIMNVSGINQNGFMKTKETILLYHLHNPTGELQFTVLKQN